MIGPGKYDDLCTYVREQSDAAITVVIVIGGKHGEGFCLQSAVAPELVKGLPNSLRHIADQIEADLKS